MKKSIVAFALVLGLSVAGVATVNTQQASAQASYCGSSAWEVNYRKTYQYPTGTYWQNQIANAPDYYATNNAYYLNAYGCQ